MNRWIQLLLVSSVAIVIIAMIVFHQADLPDNEFENMNEEHINGQIEIRIMTMFGGTDPAREAFEIQLENFMEENKQVKIINESMTSVGNEFRIAVKTSFTTGNEADITFFYTGADAEGIIKSGNVMSLGEMQENYPYLGNNIRENAFDSVREKDGEIYAIPLTGFYEGLFVNTTLFEQYNIPLPMDWDLFMSSLIRLREKNITPMAAPLEQSYYLIENFILVESSISNYYNVLEGDIPVSWINGLNQIQDVYNQGGFGTSLISMSVEKAQQMFIEGEAAMILEGSWFTGLCNATAGNIIVMPMPIPLDSELEEGTVIGGFSSGYYVSRNAYESEKQEMVMKLLNYLIQSESIRSIAMANGGIPSSDIAIEGSSQLVLDGYKMVSEAKNLVMPIDSRLITEAFSYIVDEGLPYLLYNKMSAEEILDEVKRIQNRE